MFFLTSKSSNIHNYFLTIRLSLSQKIKGSWFIGNTAIVDKNWLRLDCLRALKTNSVMGYVNKCYKIGFSWQLYKGYLISVLILFITTYDILGYEPMRSYLVKLGLWLTERESMMESDEDRKTLLSLTLVIVLLDQNGWLLKFFVLILTTCLEY